MILYLGTSSLIKLYVNEQGSDMVREWVRAAEIVATCKIAYTEVMTALDLRLGSNDLTAETHEQLVRAFSDDWSHIARVDFNDFEAGKLVSKYGINRFGAVHLSAAMIINDGQTALVEEFKKVYRDTRQVSLFFSSSDERLCRAAASEGLKVLSLS